MCDQASGQDAVSVMRPRKARDEGVEVALRLEVGTVQYCRAGQGRAGASKGGEGGGRGEGRTTVAVEPPSAFGRPFPLSLCLFLFLTRRHTNNSQKPRRRTLTHCG